MRRAGGDSWVWLVGILMAGLVLFGAWKFNDWQVTNCENDGGQAVTRTFGLEYTGCVGGE